MSEATTGQPVDSPAQRPGLSTAPDDQARSTREVTEQASVLPAPSGAPVPDQGRATAPTEGADGAGHAGTGDRAGGAAADGGPSEGREPGTAAGTSAAGGEGEGGARTGQSRRRRGSRGGRGRGARAGGEGTGQTGPQANGGGGPTQALNPPTASGARPGDDTGTAEGAPADAGTGAPGRPGGPSTGDAGRGPAPAGPADGAVGANGTADAASPRPKIGDSRPAPAAPAAAPPEASKPAQANGNGQGRGGSGGGRSGRGRGRGGQAGRDGQRRNEPAPTVVAAIEPAPRDGGPRTSNRRGGRERRGKAVGRYLMCVRVRPEMTQIALLEGRTLVEHYVSKAEDDATQIDGNVYRGRVQNVLPGMEAAFVDIGTPKNAVLYRGDVRYDPDDVESGGSSAAQPRIEEMLRPGQVILCQVTKNPIGAKGARLTQEVSLPGRFVVLVPNSTAFGISKRLDDGERKRLRKIVDAVRPAGHGLIVRTAAAGATAEELQRDVEGLVAKWDAIAAESARGQSAGLLYREPAIAVRVIREELNREYRAVVIDDFALYEQVRDYVGAVNPELADRVEYFDPAEEALPIFERYHVHEQLYKALDRKVYLPSGGSLVIDRTEALTVIDVNTGKNVGTTNLEETVFRNNLEAAEEVARQLRLRDIGGIIVIDFIDMEVRDNRAKVANALRSALARDKTRTQVFDISELGLVEMTRKRVSEGLIEALSTVCDECGGRGIVFTGADL